MPSRGWYVLAAVIFVGAMAGAVWFAIARAGGIEAGLQQVVVPGGADLNLRTPGTYTIFHERTSRVGGQLYTADDISGLRVTIRSAAAGREIPLRRPSGSSTYNLRGRSGTSVFAFDVDTPGIYRLTGAYGDGRQEPRTVLAVGTGFLADVVSILAISGGIALAGTAISMTMFIIVLLKRRKVRRGYA
jgi:hypothetical protein